MNKQMDLINAKLFKEMILMKKLLINAIYNLKKS